MNDDEYGARLLRPLSAEPPAATRIDLTAAMRVGRRLRRTRIWSMVSGLTAVTAAAATGSALALSSPAHPKPHLPPDPTVPAACAATRLPAGGANAAVTGGDPSGTYLVGTTNPDYGNGKRTVLVWRAGALVARTPAEVGKYSVVMTDINASGEAVGSTRENPFLPYVYRAGRISRLAGAGVAKAVNDAGTIAGDQTAGYDQIPVRWAGPGARPEVMRMPPGFLGGQTMDLAEDGTVAVRLHDNVAVDQTFLWRPDGTVQRVGAPKLGRGDGTALGFWSVYFRSGWLYGTVKTAESDVNPYASVPPDVDAPPRNYQVVHSPVYRYHVAGGTWQKLPAIGQEDLTVSFGEGNLRSFIGRTIYPFPPPVTTNADDFFEIAVVSDDGRTAGGRSLSRRADTEHHNEAFIWRCR